MNLKTYAIAALAVLAAGGSALAMEPGLPRSESFFQRIDVDSDGKLTLTEIRPGLVKRFQRVDANADGEVTTAEIDVWLTKAIERRKGRILARLDADKSGGVSQAELDAAVELLFNTADADKDGGVSFDEARAFRAAKRGQSKEAQPN